MKLKKLFLTLSVLAASACMALGFAACDDGPDPTPPVDEHVHDYGAWTKIDATCLEEGSRSRTCSICGDVETHVISRLDHDMSRRQGKEPTCTEPGWAEYEVCSRGCGTTTYRELPELGHEMKTHDAIPPYCTEGGYEEWEYCDRKGCDYSDQEEHAVDPLGHVYEDGSNICKRCKEEKYDASTGLSFNLDAKNNWYEVTGVGDCMDEDIFIPETYMGKTVKVIGSRAFASNKILKSVTSRTVTIIKDEAFASSTIVSINMPKLATLGSQVFQNCKNITEMTFPGTVSDFGQVPFYGCDNLVKLDIEESSSRFRAEGNCIIDKVENSIVLGCNVSTIPESVTGIGRNAFMFTSITEIEIPDNITKIGTWAFAFCNRLSKVTIGCRASIDWEAFRQCNNLTQVIIEKSVPVDNPDDEYAPKRNFAGGAFSGCDMLSEITFTGTMEEFLTYNEGALKGTPDAGAVKPIADYKHYTVECSDGALKEESDTSSTFVEAARHEFMEEYIAKIAEWVDAFTNNVKEFNELSAEQIDAIDAIAAECKTKVNSAESVYDAYLAYRSAVDEIYALIDANADAE